MRTGFFEASDGRRDEAELEGGWQGVSESATSAKPPAEGAKIATPAVAITASSSPTELARAALAAQGGEKFRSLKSMVLRGSVDLYAPNSTQSIPGGFVWVIAGDKVFLEIDARPVASFKQIFDGQRSYSSLPGVEVPPASKFGLPVLARLVARLLVDRLRLLEFGGSVFCRTASALR